MKVSKISIELLQKRLKNVSSETSLDEFEELSDAVNVISQLETTDDILELAKDKLIELENYANENINDIKKHAKQNQEELSAGRNNELNNIDNSRQNNKAELGEFSSKKQQELNSVVDNFALMNDIPEGNSIIKEIPQKLEHYKFLKSKEVKEDSLTLPFLFGILSRYDDYYAGFMTEMGTWHNGNADIMFNFLTGCHEYTTDYTGFYLEPRLCFLQGSKGNFIKKKSYTKHQINTNMYKYPYAALGCIFVKNTTDTNIVTSIDFGGSSYATTGGAGVFLGIPNYENEEITWTNVYAYSSSSSGFSNATSVTVPADTSVAILFYTSSYYITTPSSAYYHGQFIHWRISNVRRGFLVEGLEVDIEKTLKAWQCPGLLKGFDIFR